MLSPYAILTETLAGRAASTQPPEKRPGAFAPEVHGAECLARRGVSEIFELA